jgi:hypothetical protein
MEKRLLQLVPTMRVSINDTSARKTCRLTLAARLPEEDKSDKEKDKGKI